MLTRSRRPPAIPSVCLPPHPPVPNEYCCCFQPTYVSPEQQTLVDKYGRDPAWKDPEADTKAPKKKKPSTAKQVPL